MVKKFLYFMLSTLVIFFFYGTLIYFFLYFQLKVVVRFYRQNCEYDNHQSNIERHGQLTQQLRSFCMTHKVTDAMIDEPLWKHWRTISGDF